MRLAGLLLIAAAAFACGPVPLPSACFPEVQRPPSCATTWATARAWCTESRSCTGAVSCTYPGLGDLRGDQRCPADAVKTCVEGVWRCGQ
jgi:hypothetical protein